ncbi:hypothetical protein BJV78DRAFT_953998 [Lactifluus subvellereus]|nr:hypothetical protein BJV78DRAFT_953998 [Lactifluus subvellereus]
MPTDEDEHSSGIISESHPVGPEASSPLIVSVPAANGQDFQNDHTINPDALPPPPPPLGVKLTAYRLLNMSVVFSFGLTKGILTYMGQSIAPTMLDWVAGVLLTIALYWIGLYESVDAKTWEWFFHVDLAHSISYSAKRFIGGGEYLAS